MAKCLIILLNDLQRVQNCAAGYVLGRYAKAVDVVNLNWLPVFKGIEYNISKLTYHRLNDKDLPSYLPNEIVTQKRTLHSNNSRLDHVLITVKNLHFKIKLKTLSTDCQLLFNQMKVK